MSTKTMRLPPRRVSMPNNKKRQERDDFDLKNLTPLPPTKLSKPAILLADSDEAAHEVHSNQLLAGYLAQEFLCRGTLFGQPWDPDKPEQTTAWRGIKEEAELSERSRAGEAGPVPKPKEEKHQRYVEVASLLRANGAHIPGIVNPTQLARLLQM